MADQSQRTEKPTKRKLDKSRREGQFPASREFLAALQFLTFVILAGIGGAHFVERTRELARYFLAAAFRLQLSPHGVVGIYRTALSHVFGEEGRLVYRGYDIHELAGKASFEEVAFLLWIGQFGDFVVDLLAAFRQKIHVALIALRYRLAQHIDRL